MLGLSAIGEWPPLLVTEEVTPIDPAADDLAALRTRHDIATQPPRFDIASLQARHDIATLR